MKANNGTMRTDTQFSVFLANKPAILAKICQRLADDKINIVAMSMMDSTEHGVLRVVAEDAERARESLAAVNVPTAETIVLLALLPNRPGALADVVARMAANHIGVNYAYCTTGAPGGKTTGVFCITDIRKATKILSERLPRRKSPATTARKVTRPRRR
ncbi:MAG: hypothetical protein KAY37_17330 [Phycisphaerae bacterium]|nr:hypothetical protein [Phycisphaerae bacterium]